MYSINNEVIRIAFQAREAKAWSRSGVILAMAGILFFAIPAPFLASTCPPSAPGTPPVFSLEDDLLVADGAVNYLSVYENTLYIGGAFEHVGKRTGGLIAVDKLTGVLDEGWPQVSGTVNVIVPDGSGGWYIGGDFTKVGAYDRVAIARIHADKTVDPCFRMEGYKGYVDKIAIYGSTLYVSGSLEPFPAPLYSKCLWSLDATDGSLLSWDPALGQPLPWPVVSDLLISGDTLYVAGSFFRASGEDRWGLASFNLTDGSLTTWNPNPNQYGGFWGVRVDSIAKVGNLIVVAGSFNSIGAASRNYLAAVDATTGLADPWNPGSDSEEITRLYLDKAQNKLYILGEFTNIGGQARGGVARFDAGTLALDSWAPTTDMAALEVLGSGTSVYICGAFESVNGQSRKYLANLDYSAGALKSLNIPLDDWVHSLAEAGSLLLLGGSFSLIDPVERKCAAAIDLQTGQVTPWQVSAPGLTDIKSIDQIVRDGDRVYANGVFFGPCWWGSGSCDNQQIAALDAASGNTVYWMHPGWWPTQSDGPPPEPFLSITSDKIISAGRANDCWPPKNIVVFDKATGLRLTAILFI